VIAVAKQLFPWLSDVRALVAFQILLHVLLCLLILALLTGPLRKLLFFMLYAINPLVIYFVTFPFYYFYQAVPSFALIFLLLARGHWKGPMKAGLHAAYLALCISLSVVLLIRSTTVAAIAAFFVLAFLWLPARRIYFVGLAAFVLIAVTGYSPSQKNFWHTAYIGIGAYPNEHMQGLSDNNGYALFERQTGVPLDASLGGNYYDGTVMSRYREISRVEFLAILRSDWPALMRNAVMNTLQGFTVGYLVGRPFVMHLAMTAAGLMVLVLLALSRQYVLAALIIVSNATFTLYYPPIPAYMYGAYALLAMGVLGVVDYFRQRFSIGRHERLECAGRS
jgi:hypothetical protein